MTGKRQAASMNHNRGRSTQINTHCDTARSIQYSECLSISLHITLNRPPYQHIHSFSMKRVFLYCFYTKYRVHRILRFVSRAIFPSLQVPMIDLLGVRFLSFQSCDFVDRKVYREQRRIQCDHLCKHLPELGCGALHSAVAEVEDYGE